MTEEEINEKAEKHCNEVLCNAHEKCYEFIKCRDWRSRRAGFFCGYEQALKDFEEENAELEEKLANADYQLEGRDLEIKELKAENEQIKNSDTLCKLIGEQKRKIVELEAQIEETKWHKLDWDKAEENPDVDKLVRVRTRSEAEYICETYSYFPTEDEIGYGSVITQFSELNGDWVDDNEIEYWCYIEPFKEIKEND